MTLDANGFTPKSLSTVQDELQVSFRREFGAGLVLTPETLLGKLISTLSERESDIQQLMLALYDSFSPDNASDISLDRVAGITGALRNPATRSTTNLYLSGNNGIVIPAGSLVGVSGSANRFRTTAEITLSNADDVTIASGSAVSCTLARSGSTVTATATAHGLPNGAIVTIAGADQGAYNITAKISGVTANTFQYTVVGTPATPATGTITAAFDGGSVNITSDDTGEDQNLASGARRRASLRSSQNTQSM